MLYLYMEMSQEDQLDAEMIELMLKNYLQIPCIAYVKLSIGHQHHHKLISRDIEFCWMRVGKNC